MEEGPSVAKWLLGEPLCTEAAELYEDQYGGDGVLPFLVIL